VLEEFHLGEQVRTTLARAGEIRDANGVPSGQNPIAGVEYLIPK
jgi:hypothetical protein